MKRILFLATMMMATLVWGQEENNLFSKLPKSEYKGFYLERDKFRDLEFLTPHIVSNKDRYFYLSQDKNGNIKLHYKISYTGKDWIFFDKIIYLYDDNKYEITNLDPKREVFLGGIYEGIDIVCDDELIGKLRDIKDAKSISIRYSGSKGVYDKNLSNGHKKDIEKILSLYDKLKK